MTKKTPAISLVKEADMTTKSAKPAVTSGGPPRPLGEAGLRFWRDVNEEFSFDCAADIALLMTACEAIDVIAACDAQIAAEGLTVVGQRGGMTAHPLLAVANSNRALFTRVVRQLGLVLEPVKDVGRPSAGFGWRG